MSNKKCINKKTTLKNLKEGSKKRAIAKAAESWSEHVIQTSRLNNIERIKNEIDFVCLKMHELMIDLKRKSDSSVKTVFAGSRDYKK